MFLFLVHDDQSDIFQRREDRAAGAHHDVGTAVLDHLPLQQTFGVVEGRMLYRHPAAKLPLEPQDQSAVSG